MKKVLLRTVFNTLVTAIIATGAYAQTPTITDFDSTDPVIPAQPKLVYSDCNYPSFAPGDVINLSGTNLNNVTEILVGNQSLNLTSSEFTIVGANLIRFVLPNRSLESGNPRFSGFITLNPGTDNVTSTQMLTVVGCPSDPPTNRFEQQNVGNPGAYVYITGSDMQNAVNYLLTSVNTVTTTFVGSVFFDRSRNQVLIPIPFGAPEDDYDLAVSNVGGLLLLDDGGSVNITSDANASPIFGISPLTVAGGSIFTITGQNFPITTFPQIGEFSLDPIFNPNFYTNISPEIATIQAPLLYLSEPYTAPVIINDQYISQQRLTILPAAPPTITGILNPVAEIGDFVTFVGTNLSGFNPFSPTSWQLKFPQINPIIDENQVISTSDYFLTDETLAIKLEALTVDVGVGQISIVGCDFSVIAVVPGTLDIRQPNFTITNVQPTAVKALSTFSVVGTGFSPNIQFEVEEDGGSFTVQANATFVNSNLYMVTMPPFKNATPVRVKASKGFHNAQFGVVTVIAPTITGIFPANPPLYGSVTLVGQNLDIRPFDLQIRNTSFYTQFESFNFNPFANPNQIVVNRVKGSFSKTFNAGDTLSIELSHYSDLGFASYSELTDVITLTAPLVPVVSDVQPRAAFPGQPITVFGQNLNAVTKMFLNSFFYDEFSFINKSFLISQSENRIVFAFTNEMPVTTGELFVGNETTGVGSNLTVSVLGPQVPIVTGFTPVSAFPRTPITFTGFGFAQGGPVRSIDFAGGFGVKFNVVNDTVLIAQSPSFAVAATPATVTGSFVLLKDQGVGFTTTGVFTLIKPEVSISGFTPTQVVPGNPITLFGTNLQYLETLKFNSTDISNAYEILMDNIRPTIVGANAAVVQIPLIFGENALFVTTDSGLVARLDYSVYTDKNAPVSTTGDSLTLLPYPIPSVSQVLTPSKIYPDSRITVVGQNLGIINEGRYLANGSFIYPDLGSNTFFVIPLQPYNFNPTVVTTTGLIFYPNLAGSNSMFAIDIPNITIHPFEGNITILGIDKSSYVSADKMVITIASAGRFYINNGNPEYATDGYISFQLSSPSGSFTNRSQVFEVLRLFEQPKEGISVYTTGFLGEDAMPREVPVFREDLLTGTNYRLRAAYDRAPYGQLAFASNTLSGIGFTRTPAFVSDYPFNPTFGSTGDQIQIFGLDLNNSGLNGVFFNGIIAPYFFDFEGGLRAIVPPGNVNGSVRLTFANGHEITTRGNFNELDAPICFEFGFDKFKLLSSPVVQAFEQIETEIDLGRREANVLFTLELSNPVGEFTPPMPIGGILVESIPEDNPAFSSSYPPVTLTGIIPNVLASNEYRLRTKVFNTTNAEVCYLEPFINISVTSAPMAILSQLITPNEAIAGRSMEVTLVSSPPGIALDSVRFELYSGFPARLVKVLGNFANAAAGPFSLPLPDTLSPGAGYFLKAKAFSPMLIADTIVSNFFTVSAPVTITSIKIKSNRNAQIKGRDERLVLFVEDQNNQPLSDIDWSFEGLGATPVFFDNGFVTLAGVANGVTKARAFLRTDRSITDSIDIVVTDIDSLIVIPEFTIRVRPADTTLTRLVIDRMFGTLPLTVDYLADRFPNEFKGVSWHISNDSLATVDTNGVVRALRNGTVTVTATSIFVPTVTSSVVIDMINQYVPLRDIVFFTQDSITLFPKAFRSIGVYARPVPDNASDYKFNLQVLQPENFIRTQRIDFPADTSFNYFEITINNSVNTNGVVTLVGTVIHNPAIVKTWVLTIVGTEVVGTAPIITRSTNSTVPGTRPFNPCDATLEMFLEETNAGIIGYQWFLINGNDTSVVVGANSQSFKPLVPGNYFVMGFDAQNNYVYQTFPFTFTGARKPAITFTGALTPDNIFDDTLLVSSPAVAYQWFVDGRLIKDATNQSLRLFYNGSYYVATRDENNCVAVSEPFKLSRPDFVDIGRSNLIIEGDVLIGYGKPAPNTLKLYPNPADGDFTVYYYSESGRNLHIRLFNSMGWEVKHVAVPFNNLAERVVNISTQGLSTGLYSVQLIDGNEIVKSKIFIK